MAELFGFEIKRKTTDQDLGSFVPPTSDDGAVVVAEGGVYGQYVDLEQSSKTEGELVTRYRNMAMQPECENAIDDIVNESIVYDPDSHTAEINLDAVQVSDSIKQKINEEFLNVKDLLDFERQAYEIFRHWYIDGRMYYHKIIDKDSPRLGITELRYIDPRKIKKIREVRKQRTDGMPSSFAFENKFQEYYIFNERGIHPTATSNAGGLRIATDAIAFCPSGLVDQTHNQVLSYLHKAIKPVNQLRMIEDAVVIYRIARAPERRIFYIDVGNLPKIKAEQYLRDVMARYRNKLVYDASTGEIRDDRNYMSMLEDFWLPRREGGRGTEITTLPGGQNLGEIQDIEYFQKKLYRSLNIPISRLEGGQGFNLGRAAEISRDEVKFTKFVGRLRKKFCMLFHDLLKTQLILKGVIAPEEWDSMQGDITYSFLQDGYFAELKHSEMMRERVQLAQQLEGYVGKYFSNEYIRTKILKQNETEIDEIDKQIEEEGSEGQAEEVPVITPRKEANGSKKEEPTLKPKEGEKDVGRSN